MVFIPCIVNAIFAKIAIFTSDARQPKQDVKPPKKDVGPQQWYYALMSFSYVGAMLSSNHALQFVSYPTQVLGKSIKPIPVMVLGVILARKRYSLQKYLFVLMIVLGVALFMYKPRHDAKVLDGDHTFGWGEILLLISLGLDGVTGGIQDRIRAKYVVPQTYQMMLWMNIWSIGYLLIGLLVTGEGLEFIHFAYRFPPVLGQLVAFSVCSAVGQNFIFMTITNFGPLPCSIMTTTRKFFTILGSVIIFRHSMSWLQWFGTILVFAGLSLDSVYKH